MGAGEFLEAIKSLGPFPGPVLAALIAGFISFAVTILAKDQKTSEFRQAWIDGLRADVADFAGTAAAMASVVKVKRQKGVDFKDYLLERHDDFAKMEALLNKILLRLNPKEHKKLCEMLELFTSSGVTTPEEIDDLARNLVSSTQVILKREWKRVKRGETSYMLLKWGSLTAFVGVLLLALRYTF